MKKKTYLFSIVEATSHKAFSMILSPVRGAAYILLAILLLSVVAWPVVGMLHQAKEKHLIQQFHEENQVLRSTLQSYRQRLTQLESSLNSMMESNPYFQTLANTSTGDAANYGVGGPSAPTPNPVRDAAFPDKDVESIRRLEKQVLQLSGRIATLDTTMANRMKAIAHYPSIRPSRTGWVSSGFGTRLDPFTGKQEHHPGLDIALPTGSGVYAAADGVVKDVRNFFIPNKSYGRYIIIDHGYGYETLYGHLSKTLVKKGQRIKRWDLIAHSGNTGKSTAPHLHYGVYASGQAQNPLDFILE